MNVSSRILDITSELGELAKEYLKVTNYGTKPFKYNINFELEFGDVFYSIFSLASELNIDAEKALDRSLEKYRSRIERKSSNQ
jgi:NTP pyrophosphatase (non-canonical NTP hydrolase)